MTELDLDDFTDLWVDLLQQWDRKPTVGQTGFAFDALSRFELADIRAAAILHVNDPVQGKFCATPSHLVAQIEGAAEERAGVAWSQLYKSIGRVGHLDDIVFEDPIIHAIVTNEGGWVHVCLMTDNDLKYMQARFVKQYPQYVSKSGVFSFPKILQGTVNPDRIAKGLEALPPRTVGDIDKCRHVYRLGVDDSVKIGQLQSITQLLELPAAVNG